jgi:RNA polymerase sigma-70 factor, ECF subfamily
MTMARNAGFYHAAGADDDQELALLRDTQAYLAQRAQGLTPLPHLAMAWNRFYVRYDPVIRHHVGLRRLPEPDRSDCAQEVWLSVVIQLEHFRPDSGRARLGTWIGTLARNISIDFFRRRRRRSNVQLSEPMVAALLADELSPTNLFERRSTCALVRQVLDEFSHRVSPSSFWVLYARWMEGRSFEEIAATLNLTPEQVRARHHRVIRTFGRFFEVAAKEGFPENRP